MRQRLGQHFLRDPRVVQTILAAAELAATDSVLEIGPGKGVLTREIAQRVQRLVAVELDEKLAERLSVEFSGKANGRILCADILQVDLQQLAEASHPFKVVGNLPYSITSPIFEKLMPWTAWDTGVFLIQREVAERIAAEPGSRAFGILTLAVQLYATAESILQVRPGAFMPPPKVSSTVIRLRRRATPLLPKENELAFFDLAHGAFAHRRKTLANSLALYSGAARSEVARWLLGHDISPERRAETLALQDYVKLTAAWSIFRREINLT
jgi:16S rRNA (adenine1518-N6/adenine1519-N6)-dimethyltransferase